MEHETGLWRGSALMAARDNSLIQADALFATSKFRKDKNLSMDLSLRRTNDEPAQTSDFPAF
jgi:hypothetical protein